MPKYRQLHTKIIDSFDFNDMPNDTVRLIWVLLPLILDCEGRGIDSASWVNKKMFPLRKDISDQTISEAFDWLVEKEMVVLYSVKNHNYFYVPTFKEYQRGTEKEAKSVLPAPVVCSSIKDETSQELVKSSSGVGQELVPLAASASASVFEYVNASEKEKPNVFRTYETEIGPLTKGIADDLVEDEKEYSPEWVVEALKEASRNNKRSLKYSQAILKRWKKDGYKVSAKQLPQAKGVLRIENMSW
jgi:DnaD/phage-associated family protein